VTTDIILHHYFNSPYSEKVRIHLAIKGLAWSSVVQPSVMPKPDLTPLTGGYRRIPVMQIGADVFCDSAVIMAEIERRHPAPATIHGADWAANIWADRTFFQPTVGIIFGAIADTVTPEFIADREAMTGRPFDLAAMKAAALPMKAQFRAISAWLQAQLANAGKPWVAGDAPGLADIAWYLNYWFLNSALRADMAQLLADMPQVLDWTSRMRAIGKSRVFAEMAPGEAIEVARAAEPASTQHVVHDAKDPTGLAPGARVEVFGDDNPGDRIAGTLIAASLQRIVIAREDPRVGKVHVHFPRVGFSAVQN
jgi:glutathione S-transferase